MSEFYMQDAVPGAGDDTGGDQGTPASGDESGGEGTGTGSDEA